MKNIRVVLMALGMSVLNVVSVFSITITNQTQYECAVTVDNGKYCFKLAKNTPVGVDIVENLTIKSKSDTASITITGTVYDDSGKNYLNLILLAKPELPPWDVQVMVGDKVYPWVVKESPIRKLFYLDCPYEPANTISININYARAQNSIE